MTTQSPHSTASTDAPAGIAQSAPVLTRPVALRERFDFAWAGCYFGSLEVDTATNVSGFAIDPRIAALLAPDARPGEVPEFVNHLVAPSRLLTGSRRRSDLADSILRHGGRFLSNITACTEDAMVEDIRLDVLAGRLADHVDAHRVFRGVMSTMPIITKEMEDAFNAGLALENGPRASGTQAKIACHLTDAGVLAPCGDAAFTHILKLPGVGRADLVDFADTTRLRGVLEWSGMTLMKAAGVPVAEFALVRYPGAGLAYVTERFDIRRSAADERSIFAVDMRTELGMSRGHTAVMESWQQVRDLLAQSTAREADVLSAYRMAIANQLVGNGDFHMRNLSLVKVVHGPVSDSDVPERFYEVRLAPAYDVLHTGLIGYDGSPDFEPSTETMVITVRGGAKVYDLRTLELLADLLGLEREQAHAEIEGCSRAILEAVERIRLDPPELLAREPLALEAVLLAQTRTEERTHRLLAELAAHRMARDFGGPVSPTQAARTDWSAHDPSVESGRTASRRPHR